MNIEEAIFSVLRKNGSSSQPLLINYLVMIGHERTEIIDEIMRLISTHKLRMDEDNRIRFVNRNLGEIRDSLSKSIELADGHLIMVDKKDAEQIVGLIMLLSEARKKLEQSETPFYEGMKLLTEAIGNEK